MKLSIIIIGDEILIGQVADTNSRAIAQAFGPYGWEIKTIRTVGDNSHDIRTAVETAMSESDLVISTGGLGPTKDDITKRILTDIFGGELRLDADVAANIEEIFAGRGLNLNELTRAQALVPTSCRVIPNKYGTAPVMWFEKNGKAFAALPGVPFETEGILADGELIRTAMQKFSPDISLRHHSIMVAGISESALAPMLEPFENSLPGNIHLAYLPVPGLVRLRLDGFGKDSEALNTTFADALAHLKLSLGALMIYDGDASAAEIMLSALRRSGHTVASAESCTGGYIAHSITKIAGCSDVYKGSVISYANDVKENILGVNPADIDTCGAVSENVVRQMAVGALSACGTSAAIATSGIAGPDGGTPDKPVGTVWIASAFIPAAGNAPIVTAKCHHFPGKRERVIERAATEAMLMLARMLP